MDYIFNFFRKKSPWRDVTIIDVDGNYYLLQVRNVLSNNYKEFRKASISEIPASLNNSKVKPLLYKACVDNLGSDRFQDLMDAVGEWSDKQFGEGAPDENGVVEHVKDK